MNNKAVKDAIKKGCRLFPEFDMQGFKFICKICNIPMEINDHTRLIDLEAHTKSASHIANLGSDKLRMTRAKAHKEQLSLSQSSLNQSFDKSFSKIGPTSDSLSTSTSVASTASMNRLISSSTPSKSKRKRKNVTPVTPSIKKSLSPVHPSVLTPTIIPAASSLSCTSTSSSFASASSSSLSASISYSTSCSTPPINKTKKSLKTKKTKTQDKVIILSDDTQESVYLIGPDDELDKSSSSVNNKNSKANITNKTKSSQDFLYDNRRKSFKSASSNMATINSTNEPISVPSTSTVSQADSVTDAQAEKHSESQDAQKLKDLITTDNKPPEPLHDLKNDSKVDPKSDVQADSKTNIAEEPMVTTSDLDFIYGENILGNDPNIEEITSNGKSDSLATTTIRPGDSLLVSNNIVTTTTITLTPQLALKYPLPGPISENANETKDETNKTIETSVDLSNQTSSNPEIVSNESTSKPGVKETGQRKRKQDIVREAITPNKTVRSCVGRSVSLNLDSSSRKMKQKRKTRITGCVSPSTVNSAASSLPTSPAINVNSIKRSNSSTDKTQSPNWSESALLSLDSTNNFNSTIVSKTEILKSSPKKINNLQQSTFMPSPILAITNEVTSTESNTVNKSNGLDTGAVNDQFNINSNITANIKTTIDNNITPTTSTVVHPSNEKNGKIKQKDEISCESENLQQLNPTIKSEPLSDSNTDYQPCRDELYADLINLCLDANFSFNKLTGPSCRSFFQKHFAVTIPSIDDMKTNVLKHLHDKKIEKLKQLVADNYIYLIIKIHKNDIKGHILTVMVGILNGRPTRSHLYKLSILKEIDLTVLSREILTALHNLYQGLVFDKLTLLITDDSSLMEQIGNFLRTLYPKLRHIPCFYQVCDNICERFRKTHPLIKLYVNTINNFFFTSPKLLSKYKQVTTKSREVPIPMSKLHGFDWMLIVGDFFEEINLIADIIDQSLDAVTRDNYLANVHYQIENKDLLAEWIDFDGYQCIEDTINLMKSKTLSLPQMKQIIGNLGRNPKRSFIQTQIKDLLKTNLGLSELMTIAGEINKNEDDSNYKIFNYAPLSTLDSFNCYNTFQTIMKENDGSLEDSILETLTFLACNKDL